MRITTKVKDPYTLGQVLQQTRMIRGVSQRELASELGISQKWVWEMEQGKPGILMDRLFSMLEKNGVTLSAEFEYEEEADK